ncbi:MAG: hypothetical protein JSR44_03215 [Spirochaetes bacterium]|nr:hypothetical protein [Spirochaetota bacterium]
MQVTPRRALESFVLQKKLSPRKLRNLVQVATTAERLGERPYLERAELDKIVGKFGVAPDVTTWGDFFAAEIATDHWEKNDAAFEKICETVVFDFIAACLIFSDKPQAFIASAMAHYQESLARDVSVRDGEDLERIHLGILGGYFTQMGLIKDRLNDADMAFFDSFSVRTKIA